jgi:hypothetical protein
MENFRMGMWTAEELKTAKEELDNCFAPVREAGLKGGKIPANVYKKLEEDKFEIAELIVTVINESVVQGNMLPLIVDEVSGDWRNDYIWTELQKSLRVDLRSPGSKPLSQLPFTWSEYGMEVTQREVAVEVPLELLATGKVTASMVADVIAQGVLRDKITRVTNKISDEITAIDDRTGESGYGLRYSGLTKANLDKAIDGMADEGDGISFFGRYIKMIPTLRTILAAEFNEEITGEVFRRGIVGDYHGARFIAIKDQFSKEWGNDHFLRSDLVWGVGARKGAIHMTQDVSFLNWSEVSSKYASFGTGFRYQDGTLVHDPYRYRVIDL